MKRGAGADIFLKSIEKMRRTIPNLTLRTSFIVGFPGETEEDFEELCEFVREAQFDWLGVFGYSDEEGAKAFALDDKVSPREIERRRKKLMQIQRQISRKKRAHWSASSSTSCSKAPAKKPTCSGKAAPQCTLPRSTAKSSSTISETTRMFNPASFSAVKSPKPTTTI